jgi:predicted nucleotidyltransferase
MAVFDRADFNLRSLKTRFLVRAAKWRFEVVSGRAWNLQMINQIRQAKSELAEICRRHNVRRLDLFGSAVGSNFDPRTSDLDFLVEFGVFTKGEYSEHYFALIEDLKSLLYAA